MVQSLRQETPSLDNGLVSPQIKPKRQTVERPTNTFDRPMMSTMERPVTIERPTNTFERPTFERPTTFERPISDRPNSERPVIANRIPNRARSRTLTSFDKLEIDEPEEDRCEIRRGSNPLLDPYGVPMKSKPPAKSNALAGVPSDLNQKIRVCVRKRPLNKKELDRAEKDIAPTCGIRSINIQEPK